MPGGDRRPGRRRRGVSRQALLSRSCYRARWSSSTQFRRLCACQPFFSPLKAPAGSASSSARQPAHSSSCFFASAARWASQSKRSRSISAKAGSGGCRMVCDAALSERAASPAIDPSNCARCSGRSPQRHQRWISCSHRKARVSGTLAAWRSVSSQSQSCASKWPRTLSMQDDVAVLRPKLSPIAVDVGGDLCPKGLASPLDPALDQLRQPHILFTPERVAVGESDRHHRTFDELIRRRGVLQKLFGEPLEGRCQVGEAAADVKPIRWRATAADQTGKPVRQFRCARIGGI